MVINTNIAALTSARYLNSSTQALNKSLERLSSGSSLVSPSDNPGNLGEATRLQAQIGQIGAASENIGNAVSFGQTQDAYLQQIGAALSQMSTLAIQAQDVTKTESDRANYQAEFSALTSYVNSASNQMFNGVSLFSATALNVLTDASGGVFSMGGTGTSFSVGNVTTTTSTTTTYPSLSTTLGQLDPSLASGSFDLFMDYNANNSASATLTKNNTLQDFLNLVNTANSGATASYDSSTGQLAVNLDAATSHSATVLIDSNSGLLAAMGFSTDSMGNLVNPSTSSPLTATASLAGTTSTTTTTAPSAGTPDISTLSGAVSAMASVTAAINQLATARATVGANLEHLSYSSQQLTSLKTNLASAASLLEDVDIAQESTNYAKEQILVQSGTSMLAQANSSSQSVLKLLG